MKESTRDYWLKWFWRFECRNLLNWMPDFLYLKICFYLRMGHRLNLKNPQTFNEKLQWLKLYNRKPEYTMMVDKYEVKKYVAEKIGEEYVIPTLGIWERFEEIDFDKLPDQFVLKCTHDSGGVVICKDKKNFDIEAAKEKLNKSLRRNYFYSGREWPYKNVKPRIIAEKCILDSLDLKGITDYKFLCFSGKVKCIFTCTERYDESGLKVTFFDTNWRRLPFCRHYPSSEKEIQKPQYLEKMIGLSEILSKGIPFVRCDFYEVQQEIYFGEMTFFPGNGMEEFNPEEWDYILGDWISLPRGTSSRKGI